MKMKDAPYEEHDDKVLKSQVVSELVKSDTIKKLLATATTPESAQHFATRMKNHELADTIQTFANGIAAQYGTSGDYWTGVPEATDFQKFQEKLGESSAQKIKEGISGDLKFTFALSEVSDFLRGASSEGQKLPPDIMDAIDKLFNSWLVKNDMMSQDSAIYSANAQGAISSDAAGQKIKAVKAHIQELIHDPEKGFSSFAATKGLTVVTKEAQYPEQKSEAEQQADAEAAAKETAVAETKGAESTAPRAGEDSEGGTGKRSSMRMGMGGGEEDGDGGSSGGGDSGSSE